MDRAPNDGTFAGQRGWRKDDSFAEHDGIWLGTESGTKGETTADE